MPDRSSGDAEGDGGASPPRRRRGLRVVLAIAAVTVVAFGLIQLVPYRVDNPPVVQEPAWDSPRTRRLAVAACFDCHSNETETAWWEDIAPGSWWITNHVREGRAELNFSECTPHEGREDDDAAEEVLERSMPPDSYTWLGLHSDAKLTDAERRELAQGLTATLTGWRCDDD